MIEKTKKDRETRNTPKNYLNSNTKYHILKTNAKGITLIALIITIIVMLILVGVTISVAINGGLFANAKQAKTDTQNAIKTEQNLSNGKVNIDNEMYNSIDDYLEEKTLGALGEAKDIEDYGRQVINYKSKGEGLDTLVWRVFYKDNKNVYLISETSDTDYPVKNLAFYDGDSSSGYTKKSTVEKYGSGADVSKQGQDLMPLAKKANLFTEDNKKENIIVTAYLCDIKEDGPWDGYRDVEGKASWAMGGPTIELFVASYNATQSKTASLMVNEYGYDTAGLNNSDTFQVGTEMNEGIYRLNSSGNCWLASPAWNDSYYVRYVNGTDGSVLNSGVSSVMGCRPVVCIPTSNFIEFELGS